MLHVPLMVTNWAGGDGRWIRALRVPTIVVARKRGDGQRDRAADGRILVPGGDGQIMRGRSTVLRVHGTTGLQRQVVARDSCTGTRGIHTHPKRP